MINRKSFHGGVLALVLLCTACSVSPQEAERQIRSDLLAIDAAITKYARHFNEYPATLEDLRAEDSKGRVFLGTGTALEDPWGNRYQYTSPAYGGAYALYSLGSDGSLGGEEASQDIDLAMARTRRR